MTRRDGKSSKRHSVIAALTLFTLMAMLAGGALFSVSSARAADTPTATAALAPESTLIYLSVYYDTQTDQWQKASTLLETLGLGSLQDMIASSSDSTSSLTPEDLEGAEIGIVVTNVDFASQTASDLSGLTGGLSSTSAGQTASDLGSSDGVVAIINAKDPQKVWTEAQSSLQQDATDAGVTVESTDYEGVTIESIPADESTGDSGTAQALVGDSVVVGNSVEDVEGIIDVSTGKTAPLSETDAFKKLQPELAQEFLAFGFVNGPALEAAGMTADASSTAMLSSISLLKAYTAFVAYAVDGGFRFDSLSVNEDGSSPMPATSGFTPSLAGKVPADTMLLIDGNDVNQTGVLDAVALALAQGVLGIDTAATPTAGQSQEDYENEIYAQAATVFGFNIKTDLIDQLKGEFGLAVWGANMDDPSNLGILFVSGVDNQSAVQDVVSKISLLAQSAASGQFSVTTKTVGESTIQSIDLSSSGFPLTLDYGVVNGELIISLGTGLDTYMAGATDTLANSAGFSAALSALPANPQAVLYVDTAQLIPLVESFTGSLTASSSSSTPDAGEKCADYSSQADAQAELEAEGGFSFDLDQDFDGQACEDYFATPSPDASPTPELNLDALKSLTIVTYEKDGMAGTSALLLIG